MILHMINTQYQDIFHNPSKNVVKDFDIDSDCICMHVISSSYEKRKLLLSMIMIADGLKECIVLISVCGRFLKNV